MPLTYKIILTTIVLLVGGAVAWFEFTGGQAILGWVVIAMMAVMVLGQWVFPEAGGVKPARQAKHAKPGEPGN
ncbi:MAG: hypothetical protein WBD34_21005 [Burkholderiaceae bacterium]